MTLVDDAERLTTLAEEANAAADAGSVEAALREVLDRLVAVRPTIAYGIVEPRWWQHVPEPERAGVRAASERAAAAAGPLRTESDQVLAAYGRGDATMDRGALGALLRAFREYGAALRQAQDEVLRTWSERLWPPDQHPELEVHALVPETAAAAREILTVTTEMDGAIDDARILDGEALGKLFDRCEAATTQRRDAARTPGAAISAGLLQADGRANECCRSAMSQPRSSCGWTSTTRRGSSSSAGLRDEPQPSARRTSVTP